jgi:hypothetical protein
MTDQELVVQAYEATVGDLFAQLFDRFITATSAEAKKVALDGFKNNVKLAQEAREGALAAVGS